MKTCRISFCTMGSSHASGLCAVHATCFLLTPGARKTGVAYENALTEYVTRTEVRHHLKKHEAPDTRPTCVEAGCEEKASGAQCAAHIADGVL